MSDMKGFFVKSDTIWSTIIAVILTGSIISTAIFFGIISLNRDIQDCQTRLSIIEKKVGV